MIENLTSLNTLERLKIFSFQWGETYTRQGIGTGYMYHDHTFTLSLEASKPHYEDRDSRESWAKAE